MQKSQEIQEYQGGEKAGPFFFYLEGTLFFRPIALPMKS